MQARWHCSGRQILLYGDQRLIGPGDWNNFARTFDAAKLHYEKKKFAIDFFASTPVYIFRDSFDQSDLFNGSETHRDLVFSGIYATTTAVNPLTMDFYGLLLDEDNRAFVPEAITYTGTSIATPGTRTDFVTLGTRIKADPKKLNGWEYEGEFAFQAGQVADLDLTIATRLLAGGHAVTLLGTSSEKARTLEDRLENAAPERAVTIEADLATLTYRALCAGRLDGLRDCPEEFLDRLHAVTI